MNREKSEGKSNVNIVVERAITSTSAAALWCSFFFFIIPVPLTDTVAEH